MPSARASAIWLRPALRSTSTSRPNSPGVSASPALRRSRRNRRTPPTACAGARSPAATAARRDRAACRMDGPWYECGSRRLFVEQTNSQGSHFPGRPHDRRAGRHHHPRCRARRGDRLSVRLPVGQLRRVQVAARDGRGGDGGLFGVCTGRGESAWPHPRLPRGAETDSEVAWIEEDDLDRPSAT